MTSQTLCADGKPHAWKLLRAVGEICVYQCEKCAVKWYRGQMGDYEIKVRQVMGDSRLHFSADYQGERKQDGIDK